MSEEKVVKSPSKICPPPPPRIGPLCLTERDKDSDLSSVSDIEEEYDNQASSQKFEEVSESELEISDDDQPPRLKEDLENIESDENDLTSLSSISDNEEFPDHEDQHMCDVCLLVFENANARADHLTSSGHLLQADTQPRSKDKDESNDCRLCLKHFKTNEELKQHESGSEHQQEMIAQRVLSCKPHLSPLKRQCKRGAVTHRYSPPQKKIGLERRKSPDDIEDSLACRLCNLVFTSEEFQQKHVLTENHEKNLKNVKPPLCESWYSYFSTGSHYCYACWIGYNNVKDLMKHYTRPSHMELLKSMGISRILSDERFVDKSYWHCAEKYRPQIIDLKNFTVIDKVGECDSNADTYDVGFINHVKPASLSKPPMASLIADTEAVSSDEASDISDLSLVSPSKESSHFKNNAVTCSQLDLQDVSD